MRTVIVDMHKENLSSLEVFSRELTEKKDCLPNANDWGLFASCVEKQLLQPPPENALSFDSGEVDAAVAGPALAATS